MNVSRIAAAALLAISLLGCSAPADQPSPDAASGAPALDATVPPSAQGIPTKEAMDPAAVKDPVKEVLQKYLEAMSRGDYTAAATFWSSTAGKTPDSLEAPGVSELEIIKTTLMSISPDTVEMQVTFTAKVAAGSTTTEYRNGNNVRWFTLVKGANGFKITQIR